MLAMPMLWQHSLEVEWKHTINENKPAMHLTPWTFLSLVVFTFWYWFPSVNHAWSYTHRQRTRSPSQTGASDPFQFTPASRTPSICFTPLSRSPSVYVGNQPPGDPALHPEYQPKLWSNSQLTGGEISPILRIGFTSISLVYWSSIPIKRQQSFDGSDEENISPPATKRLLRRKTLNIHASGLDDSVYSFSTPLQEKMVVLLSKILEENQAMRQELPGIKVSTSDAL
jgi:hypothetical protein